MPAVSRIPQSPGNIPPSPGTDSDDKHGKRREQGNRTVGLVLAIVAGLVVVVFLFQRYTVSVTLRGEKGKSMKSQLIRARNTQHKKHHKVKVDAEMFRDPVTGQLPKGKFRANLKEPLEVHEAGGETHPHHRASRGEGTHHGMMKKEEISMTHHHRMAEASQGGSSDSHRHHHQHHHHHRTKTH